MDPRLAQVVAVFYAGQLDGVLHSRVESTANDKKKPEHRPAVTKVEEAQVPEGWSNVLPRKRKEKTNKDAVGEEAAAKLTLAPAGWSVPPVEACKLPTCATGVALANTKEEAEKLEDLCAHATTPLAVLSPAPTTSMDDAVAPLWVQVRTADGRTAVRKVYLSHLGTCQNKVSYKPHAAKVRIASDTAVINVTCTKDFAAEERWQHMRDGPCALEAVRTWLHDQGIKAVDVFHPTLSTHGTGVIQVKARIPASAFDTAMLISGKDGMTTWELRELGEIPNASHCLALQTFNAAGRLCSITSAGRPPSRFCAGLGRWEYAWQQQNLPPRL